MNRRFFGLMDGTKWSWVARKRNPSPAPPKESNKEAFLKIAYLC